MKPSCSCGDRRELLDHTAKATAASPCVPNHGNRLAEHIQLIEPGRVGLVKSIGAAIRDGKAIDETPLAPRGGIPQLHLPGLLKKCRSKVFPDEAGCEAGIDFVDLVLLDVLGRRDQAGFAVALRGYDCPIVAAILFQAGEHVIFLRRVDRRPAGCAGEVQSVGSQLAQRYRVHGGSITATGWLVMGR